MKDLRNFVSVYNEAKKDVEISSDWVVIDGKRVKKDSPEYKKWQAGRQGEDAASELNPKPDGSIDDTVEPEELSKNEKKIKFRMKAKQPFYVMGHAGWGKSDIITSLAKKLGYEVQIVFLDKAVKEDLGGIPIPVKMGKTSKQELAMPAWAAEMYENPDKKYLLFFDEMNQADPQVMNALMPIVKDNRICEQVIPNYIVGAAGNYESENEAVNELSGPLKSRFKPLIIWHEDWKAAFKFLHKKLDPKFGKDLVNLFERDCQLFENPREIDAKVFQYIWNIYEDGDFDDYEVDDIREYLVGEDGEFEGLFKKSIDRSDRDKEARVLAQALYDWLHRGEKKEAPKEENSRRKNKEMLPTELVNSIKKVIQNGYIKDPEDPKKKYGACEENLIGGPDDRCIMSMDEVSAEQLARIIKIMKEENGGKDPWRFHKCDEYRAKGYLDPPYGRENEE